MTGYFTNTDPELSSEGVASLVGQEVPLTIEHGSQDAGRPAVVTDAGTDGEFVHITFELAGTAHPDICDSLKAEGYRGSVGFRSLSRDGERITSIDLWTAVGTRPWAERVMRGRHRGTYATAVIDTDLLADAAHRRAVTDRTKAEAMRGWATHFSGERHGRYRLKLERVPAMPSRCEVNVLLLPEGTTL
ncbi:MAG TPA: hypothetical protein VFD41_08135 [Actinomycetales bacterium]|nr:hypothetical protein [Actinomycetales bacterium]